MKVDRTTMFTPSDIDTVAEKVPELLVEGVIVTTKPLIVTGNGAVVVIEVVKIYASGSDAVNVKVVDIPTLIV